MARLSDKKVIDKIYSDLKGINTAINKYGDLQIFTSETGEINILLGDSPFSILVAKIKFDNEFTQWLKNKNVLMPIDGFKQIVKCLKKNRGEIEYEDSYFKFEMIDADGNPAPVEISSIDKLPGQSRLTKVLAIEKCLGDQEDVSADLFEKTVFVYFENHGKDNQGPKILEIPSKNIDALLKNFTRATIRSSVLDPQTAHRFVSLSSETEFLSMVEYFATV